MILSLQKGLGAPAALPLDDAFHPDVSHWIHLVAVSFIYFHFLILFDFDVLSGLFWLLLLSQKKRLNRSEVGISISDCCRQKIILVCETIVLQKCAKYIQNYISFVTKIQN